MRAKKPLDVEEPLVVDISTHEDLIALMLMNSEFRDLAELQNLKIYETAKPPHTNRPVAPSVNLTIMNATIDVIDAASKPKTAPDMDNSVDKICSAESGQNSRGVESRIIEFGSVPRRTGEIPGSQPNRDSPRAVEHAKFEDTIPEYHHIRKPNKVVTLHTGEALACGLGPLFTRSGQALRLDLSDKDVQRWELAAAAIWKLDAIPAPDVNGFRVWTDTRYEGCNKSLSSSVPNISYNWTFAWSVRDLFTWIVCNEGFRGEMLLPLVYGGIHLSAWDFHFPTAPEGLIWKIACIGIMGSISVQIMIYWTLSSITYHRLSHSDILGIMSFALGPVFVFYGFSRLYIVLESFLSLRAVPLGVYAAVPWVQSIPHL